METTQSYKKDIVLTALSMSGVLLFIIFTNPSRLSVVLLLAFPILIAIAGFVTIRLALSVFTSASDKARATISSVFSVGLLLIVLLSSLGQLGFQDMFLALLLVAGLVFYLKRVRVAL